MFLLFWHVDCIFVIKCKFCGSRQSRKDRFFRRCPEKPLRCEMKTVGTTRYAASAACKNISLYPDLPGPSCVPPHSSSNIQFKDTENSFRFYGRLNIDLRLCLSQPLRRGSAHNNCAGYEKPAPCQKEVPNRAKIRFSHHREIAERGGAGVSRRRLRLAVHW